MSFPATHKFAGCIQGNTFLARNYTVTINDADPVITDALFVIRNVASIECAAVDNVITRPTIAAATTALWEAGTHACALRATYNGIVRDYIVGTIEIQAKT